VSSEDARLNRAPTAPDTPPPAQRRLGKKHRAGINSALQHAWQQWRVEFIAAILILLAILVLNKQVSLRRLLSSLLRLLTAGLVQLGDCVTRLLARMSLTDLLAIGLIFIVLALLFWHTRQRFMSSPRLTQLSCPRCGSGLGRVHRRWYHRVASLFVPVRLYRCRDSRCRWRGLRVKPWRTH
jgi:hypothetical protein